MTPATWVDPFGLWNLTEAEMRSANYDPWAMEALEVNKAYELEWFGTYSSPFTGYTGIEVTYEFKVKVMEISYDLGINPDDLMTLMAVESKIATQKSSNGAVGLIQFAWEDDDGIAIGGYSLEEIAQLDALQQLDLVHLYFKNLLCENKEADPKNIIDLYTLMFLPSAGGYGQSDDYRLAVRDGKNGWVYNSYNDGLDKGNKGYITRGDLRQHINEEMKDYLDYRR